MKQEFTNLVALYWMDLAQATLEEMKNAIHSDPCILCFVYRKLIVLCTSFSSLRFGWVLCQELGDNATTNQAVHDSQAGKGISMMTTDSAAVLHLVCFGSQRSCENKVWLQLHQGEMFVGNFVMNKYSHMLFGVGNLPKGYIRNVPLPRVPREQSTWQSQVLPNMIPHYYEDAYAIPMYKDTCRIEERVATATLPNGNPLPLILRTTFCLLSMAILLPLLHSQQF